MAKSRTENSFNNMFTGMVLRMVTLLLAFVSRTMFIRLLGDGCLGLNGLFTSILQMFSLAELGIGQAITFYMYKPIAEENRRRLTVLVRFYKLAYRVVGIAIGVIGAALIPFLPKLVNMDQDTGYNLTLIYLLYLANTVVTYLFFSYARTVLSAHQQDYIVNKVDSIFIIVSTGMEILALWLTGNYIVYLLVRLVLLVLKNVVLGVIALKKHSYIREKTDERLSKADLRTMFKDVYALFVVRLSSQLFNSTDNLFISAMLGTVLAGYNSNYLMIINSVYGIISTIIYSCNASVGNLCAEGDKPRAEGVFRTLDFINFWISFFCGICLYRLMNPFISLVWGEKYLFSLPAVWLMAANFYVVSSLYTLFTFRQGLGLFRHCIYNQLAAAIVNIILDFILCKLMGLEGLLIATLVANVAICVFPYAKNLYRVGFEMPSRSYVLRILRGMGLFLLGCGIIDVACLPFDNSLGGFICQVVICALLPNVILLVLFFKSADFKKAMGYGMSLVGKRFKK